MEFVASVPVGLAFGAGIAVGAGLLHWLASMQPRPDDDEQSPSS